MSNYDPEKLQMFSQAMGRVWQSIMGEEGGEPNLVLMVEQKGPPIRRTFTASIRRPDDGGELTTIVRMCAGTSLHLVEQGTDYQLISEQGNVHIHCHGPDCKHPDEVIPEGATQH